MSTLVCDRADESCVVQGYFALAQLQINIDVGSVDERVRHRHVRFSGRVQPYPASLAAPNRDVTCQLDPGSAVRGEASVGLRRDQRGCEDEVIGHLGAFVHRRAYLSGVREVFSELSRCEDRH
jgi:hypothetical protein